MGTAVGPGVGAAVGESVGVGDGVGVTVGVGVGDTVGVGDGVGAARHCANNVLSLVITVCCPGANASPVPSWRVFQPVNSNPDRVHPVAPGTASHTVSYACAETGVHVPPLPS